jgi:predicted Ser/Thr protein kinase
MAAMFAVLTRLLRPDASRYESPLRELVESLTAMEKLELYATGSTPARLDIESQKLLRSATGQLVAETEADTDYEGATGASPREMRGVLLDAAQDTRYEYLSPFAVLDGIERLCGRVSEYAWLQRESQDGGYHDHALFRRELRSKLLDLVEEEFRRGSGLVDEERYGELFDRYLNQVGAWAENEKLRNPITGAYEEPDERLMNEVEELLGAPEDRAAWRNSLMGRIAASAIERPGQPIDRVILFAEELGRLRDAAFRERRDAMARLCRDVVAFVLEEGTGLDEARRQAAEGFIETLRHRYGYDATSAADTAVLLLRERFDTTV